MYFLTYIPYTLIVFTLFFYNNTSLFAQSTQERIFVSPFKNNAKQNIVEGELISMEDIFRTEASNSNLLVMNKDNIEALLEEGETLESCHSKSTCVLDLGRKLQADYVITGDLDFYSDQYHINIRLSRTTDMSMVGALDLENKTLNQLKENLKNNAPTLITKINKNKILLFKQNKNLFISLTPNDADLYLNGIKIQKSALHQVEQGFLTTLIPGKNTITAKKQGFLDQSEEVFIPNEGISNLEFKLQANLKKNESCQINHPDCNGIVYIYSTPAGAEVWLDGQNTKEKTVPMADNSNLGTFQINTTPGEHLVELRYPKYKNAQEVIQVKKGDFEREKYKNKPIRLQPNFGKLVLKTTPSNSIIKINGELKSQQTPYIEPELTTGYYEIIVEAQKYHPKKELVYIEKGRTTELNWQLKPDYSSTLIYVYDANDQKPVFNAKLLLNGNTLNSDHSGRFLIGDLKKGKYDLLITHELYETINKEVYIDDGGKLTEIKIKLKPKYGILSLKLKDQLTNYVAYIPSIPNPLPLPFDHLRLPAANHQIKLVPENQEGFEDEIIKIALSVGESQKIIYQPKKKEGTIIINSNPFGAEVLINGENKGKTPIKLTLIQGKYDLQLKASNYDVYHDSIQITQNETLQKNIRLGQHPTFQIHCIPEKSEVWVNDQSLGTAPQTYIERPGMVEVECRFGDAHSPSKSFMSRNGQDERIHLEVDSSVIQDVANRSRSKAFWGKTLMWTGLGIIGVGASFQGMVALEMDQRDQSYQQWLMASSSQNISSYQQAIDQADQNAQHWGQASWITMGAGLLISTIGSLVYYTQPSLPTF